METTPEDLEALRSYGRELAGAALSPWEPTCVAKWFSTPGPEELVLTMQGWIDLERLRSPLLQGKLPETLEETELTARLIFGLPAAGMAPDELVALAGAMLRAVSEAFGSALRMLPPGNSEPMQDGFGTWLPVLAFLWQRSSLAEAKATPVWQALPLMATVRRNEGWREAGRPYQQRDNRQADAGDGEEESRG